MSIPKYKMSDLSNDLTKYKMGPFLDEKGLSRLACTCTIYRNLLKDTCFHTEKAAELLFYVLNPNKTNLNCMEELLSEWQKKEVQSIILTRVSGHEVYFSKKLTAWVSKRKWINISSLEAAAQCGDVHVVRRLLEKIPDNQRTQALEQLEGVKKKCTTIEPCSYICGLIDLRSAYKEYVEPYRALESARNWDELDKRWGLLGKAQKNLPWFLLQVFCNPIRHQPIPDFTKEPVRHCRLCDNSDLDLDLFYTGAHRALCKGDGGLAVRDFGSNAEGGMVSFDVLAIKRLCEVLPTELDKVINFIKLLIETSESSADAGTDKPHSLPSLCRKV